MSLKVGSTKKVNMSSDLALKIRDLLYTITDLLIVVKGTEKKNKVRLSEGLPPITFNKTDREELDKVLGLWDFCRPVDEILSCCIADIKKLLEPCTKYK